MRKTDGRKYTSVPIRATRKEVAALAEIAQIDTVTVGELVRRAIDMRYGRDWATRYAATPEPVKVQE